MVRPFVLLVSLTLFIVVLVSGQQCSLSSQMKSADFDIRLRTLEKIAMENGGNRAAGSPGYLASVEYVNKILKSQTNYSVTVQEFDFLNWRLDGTPTFSQTQPLSRSFKYKDEFSIVWGSDFDGTVTAQLIRVDDAGCEAKDYPESVKGKFVLVERGTCYMDKKVKLAVAAGAIGAFIYNEFRNPPTGEWDLGFPTVPVVSLSNELGRSFIEYRNAVFLVTMKARASKEKTYNVIADMPGGNPDNIMMIGSHLDSVPAGPERGVNDNGSGTTANLELALAFSKCYGTPNLGVRFAWWAAEELGLLGSDFYVKNLREHHPDDLKKIALYINLDMIASPNFVYFVHDSKTAPEPIRASSLKIEKLLQGGFEKRGLAHAPDPFDGSSDYDAFIANGIPSGGIASGAGDVKTMHQRALFGGMANLKYDPCYHNPCDSFLNTARPALLNFAKVVADVAQEISSHPFTELTTERKLLPELLTYDRKYRGGDRKLE